MKESTPWIIAGAATAIVAGALGGWYWYQQRQALPVSPPSAQPPVAAAPAPAPEPAPAAPAIRHPITDAPAAEAPVDEPPATLPPLDQSNSVVQSALIDLLGREPVLSILNTDGFVRRIVATVDNLPRKHAPVRLWPVQPIGGKFTVEQRNGGAYLGAANAARYEPFVRFVEGVDTRRAVAIYVKMYPLFQQAYEELGYADRYFNDRVIEVIDHLLATPVVSGPVKLRLPEVAGPIPPPRPWVMYEPVDADIAARSAGQKMLLRVGGANAERLKAKLIEIRREIVRDPALTAGQPQTRSTR
jgi:Protein of unknown function (DUF3014)